MKTTRGLRRKRWQLADQTIYRSCKWASVYYRLGSPCFLSWKYKLGLSKSLIIGVVRGTIQLVAVGYILLWAFRQSDPWVLAALILFMVGAASESALKRLGGLQNEKSRRKYRWILFTAIFLGAGLTVSYLEFVVIRPTPLWEGRYLVPLAGMIVANAMNSAALGVERFRSELELRSGEIETLLALGATQQQAVLKTVQVSASAAMLPAINMLMVLGIVALPGMMSGQILAGESPLTAVRYQLLICFSIAATAAIVTWVSIQMTQKLYFTKNDQFIRSQDSGD